LHKLHKEIKTIAESKLIKIDTNNFRHSRSKKYLPLETQQKQCEWSADSLQAISSGKPIAMKPYKKLAQTYYLFSSE